MWKNGSEGDSFGAPAVHFKFDNDNVFDRHVDIIGGLVNAGVAAKDVTQVDVHGRPGSCVITLSCPAVPEALLSRTVTICGKEYHPIPGDGRVEITHLCVRLPNQTP